MKSSRPSLCETQDIGKGPGQELMSPPHYEYDEAFLVAAHGHRWQLTAR